MAKGKKRIVSFYSDSPELERVPRGKRSKVINEALRFFLMQDGEVIEVIEVKDRKVPIYLSREKAIRRAKKRLGLNGDM